MARGEVYTYGTRAMSSADRNTLTADEWDFSWTRFQAFAWAWLWTNRAEPIVEVKVWKFRVKAWHWGSLRKVWKRPFGDCPFLWRAGPPSFLREPTR